MAMRMDYSIRALPDSFVTVATQCRMEEIANGRRNRWGEKPQRMVREEVEVNGGILIVVKGKPGHSFRVDSLEQALDLKLIEEDTYQYLKTQKDGLHQMKPRLFDLNTGERVNEQGIPINIAQELSGELVRKPRRSDHVETDVDVNTTGDEEIAGDEEPNDGLMTGHEHIAAQIDETE